MGAEVIQVVLLFRNGRGSWAWAVAGASALGSLSRRYAQRATTKAALARELAAALKWVLRYEACASRLAPVKKQM